MTYAERKEGDLVVLSIGGELDALSVVELRPALERLATAGRPVVVDLSALQLIDSSGVGAIVSLYKRLRAQGADLAVRGLRDQPLEIFRLLRLDEVLMGDGAAAAV